MGGRDPGQREAAGNWGSRPDAAAPCQASQATERVGPLPTQELGQDTLEDWPPPEALQASGVTPIGWAVGSGAQLLRTVCLDSAPYQDHAQQAPGIQQALTNAGSLLFPCWG